jgi:glycosyltransferase involved in cell wall biosynthesis
MRVLMLSKACVVGSYQKKLEALARFPDVELTVLVPPSWKDERGVMRLERQYVTGYQLLVEPIAWNGNFHLHFYPRLGRRVRQVRPDVMHIDEEPYNLATAHALWLARREGARSLFFSWQNLYRVYPLPFRWLERWVLRHADYCLAGNQESAQVWRRKGYTGPLAVIPQFGVDAAMFKPAPLTQHREGTGFVIGYAGRLVPEKGVDLLLEALADLPGMWRADVVGSGPQRETLARRARELGVADRVSLDEPLPSITMPRYYQQLDVLVLPSRSQPNWKEQFGRVLVEAMACGVPVVGSATGEIPNVIGDAGLTFPEGDAGALRERLERLMRDESLRADLARRGRERVLAHYTQARIAAQTYRVYKTLVAEPTRVGQSPGDVV